MQSNPFYYGGTIKEKYFCNRVSELKVLKADMYSGMNCLIYAPRRFGKTSLVLKALNELEKNENIKFVFMDLMYISTVEEFINSYFNLLARSLEDSTDKVVNFFRLCSH